MVRGSPQFLALTREKMLPLNKAQTQMIKEI
jgi:hypothetical protein